ncbi:hypothetical protein [Dactylosporangium sp. NPDC051484]|uniref:hypothetical protein n=1 Tax=Dactylosporangium sp. NPDC051484 TaxID=3154942 RepID=UPI00344BC003
MSGRAPWRARMIGDLDHGRVPQGAVLLLVAAGHEPEDAARQRVAAATAGQLPLDLSTAAPGGHR